MGFDPIISVTDLKKRYRGAQDEALKGINLEIGRGEFFGLLGPNAAGKSTFISVLCGITDYSAGGVRVFDRSINRQTDIKKENIGLIPQEIALYPSLTVKENILFFGRMYGLSGQKLRKRIDELVSVFRLHEHLDKLVSKCSGGIKRRVNLVAGVIHKPALILLDEPTLGVDPQLRSLIFGYLVALNEAGSTIIYTTHYMEEAETLCSRIGIIDQGRIIREGVPSELIAAMPGCGNLGQLFLNLTGRDLRD